MAAVSVLPTELVILVISFAATAHRSTAARLCLVSKWVRDIVEPILYRVLVLTSTTSADTQRWLHSTKFHVHIQCFGVVFGPIIVAQPEDPKVQPVSVRNFATDCAFYDDLVVTSDVEELHLLARRTPGWMFPQLKRLHFSTRQLIPIYRDIPFPVQDILRHPQLTHIAFSVSEEPRMSSLMLAVMRLLKEHKPLLLLYVRLLPSPTVVIRGAVDSESIDGQFASIGDPRLAMRRVNIDSHADSLISEWEHNSLCGESIWDEAQAHLQRSMVYSL